MYKNFDEIAIRARYLGPKRVAVLFPDDADVMQATAEGMKEGLINPVLMEVHLVNSNMLQARQGALRLLKAGEAEALLDTCPLDSGCFFLLMESDVQTAKHHLLSYVSVFLTPKNGRLTLLTDTLINSAPGLNEKIHIVENAIRVAKALQIDRPNIAAQFLGHPGLCRMGGVLAGTKLPIIIRSPLESPDSWLLNIALGLIVN